MAVGAMGGIDHGTDAAAADQLNALTDQALLALHDHPFDIAARPHAAAIGGAFDGIAGLQAVIDSGAILIVRLLRLVLLQLALILLLLRLILGIVGGGFCVIRGSFGIR